MKTIKKYLSILLLSISMLWFWCTIAGNADNYLEESVGGNKGIGYHVIPWGTDAKGVEGAVARIEQIIDILMPIIISLGIAVALFGGYKIMASSKEDSTKEGVRLVIFGVIGIIIIVSAKFISTTLVNWIIVDSMETAGWLNWILVSENLYEKLILPFVKFAIYIAAAILFFVLAGRVFSFLTSTQDEVRKKAGGMIARSAIGIIVILAAKQLVEAVFGKREQIINQNAENLGDIGSGIFETWNIPIVYEVINWIMALATFVVLVIIIFQTIQMLTKPDDAEIPKKIKKTLMYVAIGVIIIGAGYVISNVLLIN